VRAVLRRTCVVVTAAVVLTAAVVAGCATPDSRAPGSAAPPSSPLPAPPTGATPPPSAPSTPTTRAPASRAPATASPRAEAKRPATLTYVFPVDGHASFGGTHSGYPATDIFADCGTPVVAVTAGAVLEVSRVDRYEPDGVQGPHNGGLSVSVLGDDGVRYYGSHLSSLARGLDAGDRVRAGQRLGAVGRTGRANDVCHLHFGLSPPCDRTGDWWIRRGVVWPAPYLKAWRAGENRSPAAAVLGRRCPGAP
jgi:murein DD-endopeptidase MepM/ murein hydrolase activator NlpD